MTDLPEAVAADPRYRRVRDERARDAAEARGEQAAYLRLTRLFVVGSSLAAIAGGLVLYGAETVPDAQSPALLRWLGEGAIGRTGLILVQALGLAVAAGSGFMLGRRGPGRRWVAARMRAEAGRIELARRVLAIGHEKGPEAFRGAGAWFLDFVEGQLAYLDRTARGRDRASYRGLVLAALLAALGALASALTGFGSGTPVVLLAVLGVAIPALAAAVEKWGEATASGKRAVLHDGTWSVLSALRDDAPAFQAAIERHDLPAAMAFADRVFDVLRADRDGFAAIAGGAGGA